MVEFILNADLVGTGLPTGSTVLDFVRYGHRLKGTKIGCREGDCGACTVLVGEYENGGLFYRSMTSCLMPLGNAHGKHIVTVEGINMTVLSPVQQAMADTLGTQCGFCTPGFIMSLTGFILDSNTDNYEDAIAAIDGNICRCTGYKSIERAARIITGFMAEKPAKDRIVWLVSNGFLPEYFLKIESRLSHLKASLAEPVNVVATENKIVGGGTDIIVQKPTEIKHAAVAHFFDQPALKEIRVEENRIVLGAAVTLTAFKDSNVIKSSFSGLHAYMKLLSSTPIRNMATLAGNLANASPIGDMSIFFLALDAHLVLNHKGRQRTIRLQDFFKAYKQTDIAPGEYIESINFVQPGKESYFNFEKVSKRQHLDIASVNTACQLIFDGNKNLETVHISAGGVAPVPKYLVNTALYLKGRPVTMEHIQAAAAIMGEEIAPISDARGSEDYKRLLLRQLFTAHFLPFFENQQEVKKLLTAKV